MPIKDQIGKDFQKIKDDEDIRTILRHFLQPNRGSSSQEADVNQDAEKLLKEQLVTRLQQLEHAFTRSPFFGSHEIIGSSLLLIHDGTRLGVWMIDFAKAVPLPTGVHVDHVSDWRLGNHEDGYLFGLQNLIRLSQDM